MVIRNALRVGLPAPPPSSLATNGSRFVKRVRVSFDERERVSLKIVYRVTHKSGRLKK